jgi:hypothetical protein
MGGCEHTQWSKIEHQSKRMQRDVRPSGYTNGILTLHWIPTPSIPKYRIQCARSSVLVAHGIPTRGHISLILWVIFKLHDLSDYVKYESYVVDWLISDLSSEIGLHYAVQTVWPSSTVPLKTEWKALQCTRIQRPKLLRQIESSVFVLWNI